MAHSKTHPLSSPLQPQVPRAQTFYPRYQSNRGVVARIVFIIQQDLLTRGAGSLHQFSLYEYAHITARIVGEDGNRLAEVSQLLGLSTIRHRYLPLLLWFQRLLGKGGSGTTASTHYMHYHKVFLPIVLEHECMLHQSVHRPGNLTEIIFPFLKHYVCLFDGRIQKRVGHYYPVVLRQGGTTEHESHHRHTKHSQ